MKFLRRTSKKLSRLGRKRKKKQVWRRPAGRDNKMREKRKGYPAVVSVGYKIKKTDKHKIDGKTVVTILNIQDLERVRKDEAVLVGRVGMKRKIELAKKAKEKGIELLNLNMKKLKENKK